MKSIKILHTADFHMDSLFESMSDRKAAIRRSELRQLPRKIARLAAAEKVDLVLLCGDLLDSRSAFRETGEELMESLRLIQAPVFISPGNHDYYHKRAIYASEQLPENVYVFKKNAIEYYDFPEKGFRVYGAGFTDRCAPPLMSGFQVKQEAGLANIMCLHGDVGCPDSPYNSISVEDIRESGLDYLALGHIHKTEGLKKEGNTFYSYSGCPEGRGFDETGEKTVNIIELSDGSCSLRTVSVASRKYEAIEINTAEGDPLLSIQLSLPDETVKDIYKIILRGETDKTIYLRDLYSQLSEMFFELKLEDRTVLKKNIWDIGEENTLRGTFIAKMKKMFDNASDDLEKDKIEKSVRWGIAAIDNCEEITVHEDQ